MRKIIFFVLLTLCPLIMAQEGEVFPDSVSVNEVSPDALPENQLEPVDQETLQEPEEQDLSQETIVPDTLQEPEEQNISQENAVQEIPLEPEAQEFPEEPERRMVPYSPDFEFTDGLFPNFETVLDNNPIPPARIVTDEDMFDRAFYEKVTLQKEIVIYDENGVKKVLRTENIWGYSRNGILYINVGSSFHRVSFMGSISHFVATVTTYNPHNYDPYYYNPYYSSSYYYNRYSMPQSNVASTDLKQYLLDFQSGDIMEYDTEAVEVLLMKDPELADEYHALNNRKKKQMKFVFIRRFNEKHPLYFPVD